MLRKTVYLLLAALAFLNVTNILALLTSSVTTSIAGIVALMLAILGTMGIVGGLLGYLTSKKWARQTAITGLSLTFIVGVFSLFTSQVWIMQLLLPAVTSFLLFIGNNK